MSIADGAALEEEEARWRSPRLSAYVDGAHFDPRALPLEVAQSDLPCSAAALNRALAEARATPPVYTLTPLDATHLLAITREWNELRAVDRLGPPLSPEDVLRNVLEATARMVAQKKDT